MARDSRSSLPTCPIHLCSDGNKQMILTLGLWYSTTLDIVYPISSQITVEIWEICSLEAIYTLLCSGMSFATCRLQLFLSIHDNINVYKMTR
jgi:hypothetical protein